MIIEAYTREFEQLMLKCDLTKLEENLVICYLGRLRPSINKVVQLQTYWTLLDVQNLVFEVEK